MVNYIIIICLYLFAMYFIPNWFVWNWPFEGEQIGRIFIIGLLLFSFWGILHKKKAESNFFFSLLIITCALTVTYFLYSASVRIGYRQVEKNLLHIKSDIDNYYTDNGYYPSRLSDLRESFNIPVFLFFNGCYHYRLSKKENNYYLNIESELGNIYMNVNGKEKNASFGDYL